MFGTNQKQVALQWVNNFLKKKEEENNNNDNKKNGTILIQEN